MKYNSKPTTNFREFLESTTAGAFISDSGYEIPAFDGKSVPQLTLEFPTETIRGEVIKVNVKGANYMIQINGGTTVMIPREKYHKRYDRLPRAKGRNTPGDMVTAVFYKYKTKNQLNYSLKDFQLDVSR